LALMISDNGPGMTSDTIEKASEPFFSTKQNEGMRGLGLAIVRDIIKTHRGKMEIKSSPDTGTSVILYLPIFKDHKRVV
jgi:signal transduction histidine kinase